MPFCSTEIVHERKGPLPIDGGSAVAHSHKLRERGRSAGRVEHQAQDLAEGQDQRLQRALQLHAGAVPERRCHR